MQISTALNSVNQAIRGQRAFSPASLFAASEVGAWYDPSDLTTLFQDSAGTTPVTAVEQPVGLMLDKRLGLALGSELVTNGDFSGGTTTGWTAVGATQAVVDGQLRITNSVASAGYSSTAITTVVDRWYCITLTGSGNGGPSLRVGTAVNSGGNVSVSVSGTATYYFIATATTTYVTLRTSTATAGLYSDWDNISVKEIAGNHAYQSTSASRPVLSARVNLLTKTEQFDDAVWAKTGLNAFGSGSVANTTATTDPLGGNTADFIQESTANSLHAVFINGFTVSNGPTYTFVAHCKAATRSWAYLRLAWLAGQGAYFNLANGTVGTVESGITASITSVGNGWYRCSVSITSATTIIYPHVGAAAGDNQGSYTGDGTSGIYIWGADLRVTNDGVGLPSYQRVNTSTDYDTTGFPLYIKPNGSTQWMQTNSINFTGTNQMTVWAGLRKLSDATAIPFELSVSVDAGNNGAFYCVSKLNGFNSQNGYEVTLRGTTSAASGITPYSAPVSNVLTLGLDIAATGAANEISLRANGAKPTPVFANGDAGTGNFGNYPLYLFARGGSSAFFGGRCYGLIVRGAASDATQIANTETWMNLKTRAYA